MIAILEAQRAGLFRRGQILSNVLAGVIVAGVGLPLAISLPIASGAGPEKGIYTSVVAGLCTTLFGGTRLPIAGPTGAPVAVLSIFTAEPGNAGLVVATLTAGAILIATGAARLGAVSEAASPAEFARGQERPRDRNPPDA